MKILLVLYTFLKFYDFAANLEKFDGTLVRRGTPVEKHCYKRKFLLKNLSQRYVYFMFVRQWAS
jgi:hypothetical protein